jgi:hypothetical protein
MKKPDTTWPGKDKGRSLLVLLVLLVLYFPVALAQGTSGGPFGLHVGMTRSELVQIVGKASIVSNDGPYLTIFRTVPRPYADFEQYGLIFSPKRGLVKILALGKTTSTDRFGTTLRTEFAKTRDLLMNNYGTPEVTDGVMTGSLWDEPRDWMMGLLKKERKLHAYWGFKAHGLQQQNQVTAVLLEVKPLSSETGYLLLSYEFEGFIEFNRERVMKEGEVF